MKPTALLPLLLALGMTTACGGANQDEPKTAADEDGTETAKSGDDTAASATATPSTDKPAPGSQDDAAAPKKDECTAFEVPNLEDVLLKSACEVPNPAPTDKPLDPKKLEVKAQTTFPKVAAGARTDVTVTFTNKSKETIPLLFTIDPMPRFEIEVYDAKNNRVDLPKGSPPPLPAGMAPRVPGEPKTARINLAPNGTAKMTLPWEATKMKWAPDKLRGTPPERGYPRTSAGPLPKGKYTLKVITPLTGVFEGIDHEVSQPRTPIEVGK